jgi:glycosyltransferase involved in cell wall biosynthesis
VQALFLRDYRKFHGGTLKVWDYFNHTRAAPNWEAWIQFDQRSRWDESQPWLAASDRVLADASHLVPDLFFVAGRDWERLDRHPAAQQGVPVVNLLQHVRHADDTSNRFAFLQRPAIRICVSDAVAAAVRETGVAKGPVLMIPNALDLKVVDAAAGAEQEDDLLIVGLKQPALAAELAEQLSRPGLRLRTLVDRCSRGEFLSRLGSARVTLFLPNETEGFYLPALEGMALGTVVVCPDCLGNRSFVLPGVTGFRPPYERGAITTAVAAALVLDADATRALQVGARAMAEQHDVCHERRAYHAVLDDLDHLWSQAND